jgi:hypothetical protein
VRSEAENLRQDILNKPEWLPTAWDNRHLLNILGIREFKNNWRVGMKWRFVGGAPYTPFDLLQSSYVHAWDVRGRGIPDFSRFNSERLGSFHQLDVRVDKEFFLRRLSLNFYVDVQNAYNFKSDQQKVLVKASPDIVNPGDLPVLQQYELKELDISGGTVLPTIGVIIEF